MTGTISFPFDNPAEQRFIQIDDDGYFVLDGNRATDEAFCRPLLASLTKDEGNRYFVQSSGQWALVEAFDEPLVAANVAKDPRGQWTLILPYGLSKPFDPQTLCLDEWDRFHGRTADNLSFVLSRKAQAEFFQRLDDYDDDAIVIDGQRIEMLPWLADNEEARGEAFWTRIFQTEPHPPFDLGAPAAALKDILPQLKLNKMRVAVLGCGKGHDAAFFAEQGHLVTAFDVSPEAIAETKKRYGHLANLAVVEQDVLALPQKYTESFDLIFEHTCYCAIPPSARNQLMQTWKQLLVEGGHVLGVFFAMDKRTGPPFGGSEWELRHRFRNHFEFVYWTRWKKSLTRRLGKELVIYMKKKGVTKVTPQTRF